MWFKTSFCFPSYNPNARGVPCFSPTSFHDDKDKKKDYINTAKSGPKHVGVSRLIIWYHFKMNFKIFIQNSREVSGRF